MWEILLSNADWDCFRTLTLREILKIQNPLLENIMRFRKPYICSNKLDVQEANCCLSQFNRIWNHLVGHWTEIGWFARSGTLGSTCFCSWKCFSCFRSIGETWEWWSQTPQVLELLGKINLSHDGQGRMTSVFQDATWATACAMRDDQVHTTRLKTSARCETRGPDVHWGDELWVVVLTLPLGSSDIVAQSRTSSWP